MKALIKKIPFVGPAAKALMRLWRTRRKPLTPSLGSEKYWESRYDQGGDSGPGSYTIFAEFKAEVINGFVSRNKVRSVIEYGCGDGNQLNLAKYPEYVGIDVSEAAIRRCRKLFKRDTQKSFTLMDDYSGERAELTLSIDVIYHLIEQEVFSTYMDRLFNSALRYVIIYSSDTNDNTGFEETHVKHRKFTDWIAARMPEWHLVEHIPNRYPYKGEQTCGSFADFYVYARKPA